MSHPLPDFDGPELKPKPRGHIFDHSAPPSQPPTPGSDTTASPHPFQQRPTASMAEDTATPNRTKSLLNLTASTLFGIYQPTGYASDREEPSTPWGTGAQTPIDSQRPSFDLTRSDIPDTYIQKQANGHRKLSRKSTAQTPHRAPRRGFKGYVVPLVARTTTLFAVGTSYALLISHLHDRQELAPVRVEGLLAKHGSWPYLVFWGLAAVLLGEALPYVDQRWSNDDEAGRDPEDKPEPRRSGHDWLDVVRSIGAFVGVAFAIRKLPWQSTLQLSLTLALANPAIWFVVDRSSAGFILSTLVALTGTAALLGTNPALVPSPSPGTYAQDRLVLGVLSHESVGVATWIASVLFVSAVCFGNIGRRLAPKFA
ncbi:hypothetical protein EJ03DRAFT_319910 [Teratosphaeria nubilosa]|uniref:INSIG-domain-containing protein n=1 Tax=Teratosphaeria nubilosa TaxID=161662 RepID=A0A6G1KX05_9PEZI|nr:hypothetical protein EJ03DRAFT_319910 [Teratosphaeria nubilosa]